MLQAELSSLSRRLGPPRRLGLAARRRLSRVLVTSSSWPTQPGTRPGPGPGLGQAWSLRGNPIIMPTTQAAPPSSCKRAKASEIEAKPHFKTRWTSTAVTVRPQAAPGENSSNLKTLRYELHPLLRSESRCIWLSRRSRNLKRMCQCPSAFQCTGAERRIMFKNGRHQFCRRV